MSINLTMTDLESNGTWKGESTSEPDYLISLQLFWPAAAAIGLFGILPNETGWAGILVEKSIGLKWRASDDKTAPNYGFCDRGKKDRLWQGLATVENYVR